MLWIRQSCDTKEMCVALGGSLTRIYVRRLSMSRLSQPQPLAMVGAPPSESSRFRLLSPHHQLQLELLALEESLRPLGVRILSSENQQKLRLAVDMASMYDRASEV